METSQSPEPKCWRSISTGKKHLVLWSAAISTNLATSCFVSVFPLGVLCVLFCLDLPQKQSNFTDIEFTFSIHGNSCHVLWHKKWTELWSRIFVTQNKTIEWACCNDSSSKWCPVTCFLSSSFHSPDSGHVTKIQGVYSKWYESAYINEPLIDRLITQQLGAKLLLCFHSTVLLLRRLTGRITTCRKTTGLTRLNRLGTLMKRIGTLFYSMRGEMYSH